MFPKPLTALKKENFVVNPVSNSAISLSASSTEFTYPKLSACLPSMVRDLKFSLCCFCLFLKNHGIYSFGCSATSLADFRESSVMFCKSLNIPSQSLSTEVVLVLWWNNMISRPKLRLSLFLNWHQIYGYSNFVALFTNPL